MNAGRPRFFPNRPQHVVNVRSISEISSCFLGPRPWHIEIRHRVKKTSTIDLFGFETLKLKIRRLKLWKPTVSGWAGVCCQQPSDFGLSFVAIFYPFSQFCEIDVPLLPSL